MTPNDREHSRLGPVSGFGARRGAGQLRANESGEAPAEAANENAEHAAADGASEDSPADARQRFAAEGHLTGRVIPPQPPQPPQARQVRQPHPDQPPQPVQPQQHHPGAAPAPADPVELEVLRAQNAELTAHLQRMAADFDNFRKRARRELIQASASAGDKLLGELLAVLDDLDRALGHSSDSDPAQLIDGIRMVYDRLSAVLVEHGLEEISADGVFDPHLHEAMMLQPASDVPEGQILQVLQKGYRIGDRVLRHSKVIVAGN